MDSHSTLTQENLVQRQERRNNDLPVPSLLHDIILVILFRTEMFVAPLLILHGHDKEFATFRI